MERPECCRGAGLFWRVSSSFFPEGGVLGDGSVSTRTIVVVGIDNISGKSCSRQCQLSIGLRICSSPLPLPFVLYYHTPPGLRLLSLAPHLGGTFIFPFLHHPPPYHIFCPQTCSGASLHLFCFLKTDVAARNFTCLLSFSSYKKISLCSRPEFGGLVAR